MHQEMYPSGFTIIQEAAPGDCAYLIETGRVEVSVQRGQRKIVLATLGPGEVFGELALVAGTPRSASVMALADTVVNRIDKGYYREKLARTDPIVALLTRVLVDRFHEARDKLLILQSTALDTTFEPPARSSPALRDHTVVEQVKLINELQAAMDGNEFQLYYQPVVNLKTRKIAGFEALLRWLHPELGSISPARFIPLAEDSKDIIPLGRWVFAKACETLKTFRGIVRADAGDDEPWMSINVSAVQFEDPTLTGYFADTLAELKLCPGAVKVEITERVLVENTDAALGFLADIKRLGMKVALDDFGTGYSSLSYLHRFPVDFVKLDRSFVNTMLKDERSLKIIHGLTAIADDLAMALIAEGVEHAEEVDMLARFGCGYVQGFYFSRPLPLAEAAGLLRDGEWLGAANILA